MKFPTPQSFLSAVASLLTLRRMFTITGWGKKSLLLLLAASVAGVIGGIFLQRERVPARLIQIARSSINPLISNPTRNQVVAWRNIVTNVHVLQVAEIKISSVSMFGGALAEVAGNIVITSPQGQLSYMDRSNQLHPLDIRVPMQLDALRRDPLYKEPLFDVTEVRTHSLLAVKTQTGTFDLYATFNRFAGSCFEFVVSRISIEANDQVVRPIGDWHDVWTAKPCVPLKDRGSVFVGSQSGGRMAQLSDDKILVTVGDHQMDGFYDSRAVSMDPAYDLGKLIELNIKTGAARQFAFGLRNPQGLAIARDGRIWETEHGPQGGDEVNLMVEGRNYGWPIVTYGMAYGYPPQNWSANPTPGAHDEYTRPRFAFVPSIGISNIIAPSAHEFPNWARSLILCSLRANTLYVLRTEGDDIVYAEPISLSGYRLRDIVSLPDGRLAILADRGSLLLIRNGETHNGDAQHFEVSGLSAMPRPSVDEEPQLATATNGVERGRQYFRGMCGQCHSLGGEATVGPPLNGVVGRRVGGASRFGYSPALARRNDTWTEELLTSFMVNPKVVAPGTTMPETGIWVDQAQDVARFLKTTRE